MLLFFSDQMQVIEKVMATVKSRKTADFAHVEFMKQKPGQEEGKLFPPI